MLSIIICSRIENIKDSFAKNIKETIGCDYELVVIDNSRNSFSIFEAYNVGIKRSAGELLCFIHDDIFFETKNWGEIIKEIFLNNPNVGLLGIAGGKIKTKMPSPWWGGGENFVKIVQHYKDKPKKLWDIGFEYSDLQDVAAIDGVFMVMRKDQRIRFDERLEGFHNYDLMISLLNRKYNKKVAVTSQILLEHLSEGNLNKSWYESTSKFHRLYEDFLPIYIGELSQVKLELRKKEVMIGYDFILKLLDESLPKEALYWWWQLIKLKPISIYHFKIFRKLLF